MSRVWPLLFLLAAFAQVSATFDPYRDPRWSGGVEFIGEYLALRPCLCDLDYLESDPRSFSPPVETPTETGEGSEAPDESAAAEDGSSTMAPLEVAKALDSFYTRASCPSGTAQGVDTQRDHGFRIGVAAVPGRGCRDYTLTYAGLWTRDRNAYLNPVITESGTTTQHAGGIWPTRGFSALLTNRLNSTTVRGDSIANSTPAKANVSLMTHWSCWDGEVGRRWIQGCDLWLRGFFGVRGTLIRVLEKAHYSGIALLNEPPFETQKQDHRVIGRSQCWGVGPRAGIEMRYDIACGVGLGGRIGGGLFVGGRRNELSQRSILGEKEGGIEPPQETASIRNKQRYAVFPEIDARFGVNYLSCSGERYFMFVEVGYNITSFINALNSISSMGAGGPDCTAKRSFTLTGLYVSATLRY